MLISALFEHCPVAVLCGPHEHLSAVAFRAANEVAAAGGQVLVLRRDVRGSEQPSIPGKATMVLRGGRSTQDPLSWPLSQLRRIDEIHVNNMHELRHTLGMVQTLQSLPSLLLVESLGELIDPLYATDHGEFDFLNQALLARCLLDDTAAAVFRLKGSAGTRPLVLITDTAPADSPYIRTIAREGGSVGVVSGNAPLPPALRCPGCSGVSLDVRAVRPDPSMPDGADFSTRVSTAGFVFAVTEYLKPSPQL